MNVIEETIDATLDPNGQLRLTHQPQVPPGPVRVTIRAAAARPRRGLADVIRDIAAEQRSAASRAGRQKTCVPNTMHAWPRTPSGIGSSTPRAADPRRGGSECCTTSIP